MQNYEHIKEIQSLSLKWIINHLEYFDMRHKVSRGFRWRIKTFVELIFLTNYLVRNRLHYDHDVEKLVDFISVRLQDDQLEEFIHFDPDGLAGLAIAGEFLCLTEQTTQHSIIRELNKFTAFNFDNSLAKIPFRKMDLSYSLNRAGVPSTIPDLYSLYSFTAAGQDIPNTYMTDTDAYSITHTIFYITDMGHKCPEIREAELETLKAKVLKFLSIYICLENLDIISELIMCCVFLNIDITQENIMPLYKAAWKKIYSGQMTDGSIPGITYDVNKANGKEYVFTHCYHTTLVTVGAACACLYGGGRTANADIIDTN
ncbi:hypothetical protein [Bacillus sp. C28GYM-DRY-1]|uniref:DUF6895 family protein n=1 Tax=Bacillus sp. C28GYM-DRY-1 TaxID=3062686 RepID=UPI0026763822|nr:hypothetical protein [Bacillus sp. C28GYM-DRY-1]MDO3662402.1 hypothetical protein [Bacillus sp. C28GYM-DRY-1]